VGQTKIGNTLLKMGKGREAGVRFDRALATAKLSVSLEHNDFPALNAAAEAHSGAGDLAAYEARNEVNESSASKLRNDACTLYDKESHRLEAHFEPCANQWKWLSVQQSGRYCTAVGSLQSGLSRQTNRQGSQIGAQAFPKKLKLKMIFTKVGRVQNSPHRRHLRRYSQGKSFTFRQSWRFSLAFEADRFNRSRTSPGARHCAIGRRLNAADGKTIATAPRIDRPRLPIGLLGGDSGPGVSKPGLPIRQPQFSSPSRRRPRG
jgi:hypothetical protein